MAVVAQIVACLVAAGLTVWGLAYMLHLYHSWKPQYGDKFGTGRRDQIMGYRCRRCWQWKPK